MGRGVSKMRTRATVIVTGPRKGTISRFFICFALFLAGVKSKVVIPGDDIKNLKMDGLIISGGDDLYHALFEQETCELEEVINYQRDLLEYTLLYRAIKEKKPVLGICRGYQLINVFFGGTLHKDIRKGDYKYRYTPFPWKKIELKEDGLLCEIVQKQSLKINTLHYQAVDKLAKKFRLEAVDDYNITQAISSKSHDFLIFGVQWHPEYLFYMKSHFKIFKKLVEAVYARVEQ
jgi:putative glutamine amidotransferase